LETVRTWSGSSAADQFTVLDALASALADTTTPDDVARVALSGAAQISGVVRVGMAVNQGAGRELRFVAGDGDAVTATSVRWCQIDGLADVPLAEAVREGTGVYLASLDELGRRYPHMLERQRSFGTRSLTAVPLVAGTDRLGGLLLSFDTPWAFDRHQRAFLQAFATQVAHALQRTSAPAPWVTSAAHLQRSLLPESVPDAEGLLLATHYHAGSLGAHVGGDWYDVLPLADGSVLVAVGDVMGKGSSAAVVMGQVRTATRAYALLDPAPALVLERLDALVHSLAVPEQIVTMLCGLVSPDRSVVTFAVAGHPPPLLVPADSGPAVVHGAVGAPLGLGTGPWPEQTLDLDHTVTLLLYSNGLVQSRETEFFAGLDRLCDDLAAVEAARRAPRELCARLAELAWDRAAEDDVTLLALRPTARRRLHTATEDLPADATASPLARRFLTRRLREWGVDQEVTETAQLCVSELVTNAVIHACTPSQVTLRLDDERLLVAVRDQGARSTVRARVDDELTQSTGRGLTIVDVLAASWSAERGMDGTTVWFELDVSGMAN
jgi:serine phosphatase RsbU (regulator of sigma subunit)/anti-sigma regulatory factor (Ser/Thr protein kinase)